MQLREIFWETSLDESPIVLETRFWMFVSHSRSLVQLVIFFGDFLLCTMGFIIIKPPFVRICLKLFPSIEQTNPSKSWYTDVLCTYIYICNFLWSLSGFSPWPEKSTPSTHHYDV